MCWLSMISLASVDDSETGRHDADCRCGDSDTGYSQAGCAGPSTCTDCVPVTLAARNTGMDSSHGVPLTWLQTCSRGQFDSFERNAFKLDGPESRLSLLLGFRASGLRFFVQHLGLPS